MAKIKPLTGNHGDFSGIVLKAAASGHLDAVRHYLSINPDWLNQVGPHGRTMLWEAAYKGRTDTVAELIQRGADVEPLGSYYTPMYVELSAFAAARMQGHDDVAKLLADHGAQDDIFAACHRGDIESVKAFLDADPAAANRPSRSLPPGEKPRRMGWHPVHYAVVGGHLSVLKLLVQRGATVGDHLTLLVDWGEEFPDIVAFVKQQSAREGVVETPDPELMKVPEVDRPDRQGFPPLIDACRGNHNAQDEPPRVQELLDRGATINITDHKGKTALHRAGQAGFEKISELLLAHGSDLEIADNKGGTPLFDAIYHGRQATVELFIRRGANLEHQDYRGDTPIFVAARRGHVELFAELLKSGANLKHINQRGRSLRDVVNVKRREQRQQILAMLDK